MKKNKERQLLHPFDITSGEEFVVGHVTQNTIQNRIYRIDSAVILLCHSGDVEITVNFIKTTLRERSMAVFFPRDVISISNGKMPQKFNIHFFAFSINLLNRGGFKMEPSFFAFLRKNMLLKINMSSYNSVKLIMQYAHEIYLDRQNRFRKEIATNCLQTLLWEIYDKTYKEFVNTVFESDNRHNEIFRKFVEAVHQNCDSHRSVSFYADKLCISTRYLALVCRKTHDCTAKMVVDMFVIQEIKILLETTEITVQEIADKLNFPDQSYLGRFFKLHTGQAPSVYRTSL